MITLRLTPAQAKILFNTVDGAADAGACEGGNTPQEQQALHSITMKLLNQIDKWTSVKLEKTSL